MSRWWDGALARCCPYRETDGVTNTDSSHHLGFLRSVIRWLQVGYPQGVPGPDQIPLLALLRSFEDVLAWEALAGTAVVLAGALMTASPLQFLKVRDAVPGLSFALRRWEEGDDSEHLRRWRKWKLRTRIVGICLVVIGVLILHAARQGELPQPSPIFRSASGG